MTGAASVTPAEIQQTLAALAKTPKEIARLARGLDEGKLHRAPGPDAWSARDIVAHLRACADLWGGSLRRMLDEDHPTIRYVSPRGWIRTTDYLEQSFRDSLREFTATRSKLIDSLRTLDGRGWSRGATFTGTTAGRNATVHGYATRIAEHEGVHLDQLRRTLGA